MPKKLYVLNQVASDPSDGFVDADGAKPWLEFDETTDPPSARLYLLGTQIAACVTLTIESGEITVSGPGVYVVQPEGYPSITTDLLRKINGCNIGESIVLVIPDGCTIQLDSIAQSPVSSNLLPPNYQKPTIAGAATPLLQLTKALIGGSTFWLVIGVQSGIFAETITFTQTEGAGVYTGEVQIPVVGVLGEVLDVRWMNEALWVAGTSAVLNVGDNEDTDGYFAGIDLTAAPIADVNGAGGISCFSGHPGAGAYASLTKRIIAANTKIIGTVTVVGAGTGGKSRMIVIYRVGPTIAATKV